jgi:hypothetical protein
VEQQIRAALRALPVFALVLSGVLVERADAVIRPFVVGGGLGTRAEKNDLDEMLDPYTIRESTGSWEAGGGVRFFSRTVRDGGEGERIGVRLRFTLGGGSLPGVRFSGWRSDYSYRSRYPVSYHETFRYDTWSLGTFFSARVLQRGGFYLGPALQTVKFEARRSWAGITDCYLCGPGTDRATVRYGVIEGGVHYRPLAQPLRLEAFWVPARAELSTTQIVRSPNYSANFSSFKHSIGARLSYEF